MLTGATVGAVALQIKKLAGLQSIHVIMADFSGYGHTLSVVNAAAEMKASDRSTWGTEYFVIDMWYARHRSDAPTPVISPNSDEEYYAKEFWEFFDSNKGGYVQGHLTADALKG